MQARMYRGMLLDVDGTLVDSNDCHANAWADAFVAHDFSIPYAAIRTRIGMGGGQLISELTGLTEDDERHRAISETRSRRFLEHWLAKVRPLAGAGALLEKLRAEGISYIIASSAKADELEKVLAAGGVLELCPDRITSDDVERAKPHPDILEVALQRLDLDASEAVMFGDTPYDLEAAKRAKMAAIAVTSGGFALDSLADSIAIYRGPDALVAAWDQSPLARA